MSLTENAQVILLLTAPLLGGRAEPSPDLLTPGEFNRLERVLKDNGRELADLMGYEVREVLRECSSVLESERWQRLQGRAFLMAHAYERWRTRAIWIVGRGDPGYPHRLQERLAEYAPPVLYGCGDMALLDTGGLAVVGSRDVDDDLVAYTEDIGRLAASARCTLVSGGARGIDQAAMRGALDGGGCVTGVLADSLERAALTREHRDFLMDGRLVLISPYDPLAGFHVGNAMQRNKFIYALADAALVVSSDYEKGGTWAGAVEQLGKLRMVPVYVRSTGDAQKGLEALRKRGALAWPNPTTPDGLEEAVLNAPVPRGSEASRSGAIEQPGLPFDTGIASGESETAARKRPERGKAAEPERETVAAKEKEDAAAAPAMDFARARERLARMDTFRSEAEVGEELGISKGEARKLLKRLVAEGALVREERPVRYRSSQSFGPLFGPCE